MNQTETISTWAEGLSWDDLPNEVIQKAKRCLWDFSACLLGGASSTPGKIALRLALEWGGRPEASLAGVGKKVAARHAAFANATLANALDYDDTLHGHPGSTTFPVALAAGEKWNANGREFILSVVLGYELAVRAMSSMEPIIPRYLSMWDLGTLQAFGSAITAARLARLKSSEIANTLGLVSGTAPVPLPRKKRVFGEGRSMLKSAYGWAVDAAIVASEMTIAGFKGPSQALDDNLGFWRLKQDVAFTDGLGESWEIINVEFKPYMACRFLHPVLEGVETILQRKPISIEQVRKVDIQSFSLLGDEHHYILNPVSATDAQFSVPYTVAAMLRFGQLIPEAYADSSLKDRDILDLARRVNVTSESGFETAYPERLGARVQLELNDGTRDEVSIEHPKGSKDHPLQDDELQKKLFMMASPLLGEEKTDQLATTIERMEELKNISTFARCLHSDLDF
jgi:2-methylcitrate dehydratase PrpD